MAARSAPEVLNRALGGASSAPTLPAMRLLASGGPWGVVTASRKLVQGDGEPRLFDLVRDPGERRDVASREPERTRALRTWGSATRQRGAPAAPSREEAPAPDVLEALRALGYIE